MISSNSLGGLTRGAAGSRTIAQTLGISRWRAHKLMQACHLLGEHLTRQAQFPGRPSRSRGRPESSEPGLLADGPESGLVWGYHASANRKTVGLFSSRPGSVCAARRRLAGIGDSRYHGGPSSPRSRGGNTAARKGILIHSDQRVQYHRQGYQQCLKRHHITQIMSRKGNCCDNAPVEQLFRSLKTERLTPLGISHSKILARIWREYLRGYYN